MSMSNWIINNKFSILDQKNNYLIGDIFGPFYYFKFNSN